MYSKGPSLSVLSVLPCVCVSGTYLIFLFCDLKMDKLAPNIQDAIKKMPTARLVVKLTQSGVPDVDLETMDRKAMMEAWAECVLAGRDRPVPEPAAAVRYDPAIEKLRLEFDMRR